MQTEFAGVSFVDGICEPNYIYVRGKSSLYAGHSWPLVGNPYADAASRYVMSFYEHKCCLASSGNHNGCLDQYEFNRHWGIERYRSFRDYCETGEVGPFRDWCPTRQGVILSHRKNWHISP